MGLRMTSQSNKRKHWRRNGRQNIVSNRYSRSSLLLLSALRLLLIRLLIEDLLLLLI